MPEILRDPWWQFIAGVAFAFVAIVVPILIYLKQRQRKALSYEILSRTPLLSIEEEVKGKLKILFNNNPAQDVHLVVVRIINSGNVQIVSDDYERPVSLDFGENTQIFTTEVSDANPKSLRPNVNIENTKVVLEPVLLNSRDSITLKMLVGQFDSQKQISVDGRIAGVKDIRKSGERRTQYIILHWGGTVLTWIGMILFLRLFPLSSLIQGRLYIIIIFLGLVLMVIG